MGQKRTWQIRVTNKFNGESFWLGFRFDTEAEATAYAEENVCDSCNRYSVMQSPVWQYELEKVQQRKGKG